MAVVAEELVSDLIVRDGKLRSGLRSAQQTYGQGIGRMREDTKRFETEFTRSSSNISNSFRRMAGVLAAGVSLRATGQLIDGYTRLQNQLRVTGLEGERLAEVQERLREIGNQYGTDLESLATVYSRVSIAANELGASSEQILQVNEAVAAALKVSGTSAAQASGALLQLSQAMGSGVVRAEEFNSLLEGAFPLAQAAARGIERFGGSVAQLRSAIVEGEVTSREFFEGILAGAPELLEQAANANLTLAQSFTVVKNELLLYVGSAATANGITGALAEGIRLLATNLETIIPALATIAALIGARYVAALAASGAGLVANGLATARATAATQAYNAALAANAGLLNAQAVASARAATATVGVGAAARGAGSALMAAFGGPVGLAIAALGAGIYALTAYINAAETATGEYQAKLDQANSVTDKAEELSSKLATAKGKERQAVLDNARAYQEEIKQKRASALWDLTLARNAAIRAKARAEEIRASSAFVTGADGGAAALAGAELTANRVTTQADSNERAAQEAYEALEKAANSIETAIAGGGRTPSVSAAVDTDAKGVKQKKATRERDEERFAARAAEELRALHIEELQARERLATTAEERAALQREILDIERASRTAEISEAVRRKEISAQEGAARLKILETLYGAAAVEGDIVVQGRESLYQRQISLEELRQTTDDRRRVEETLYQIERDALADAYDMADTQAERRDLALQLIDLDEREQRAKLEAILAVEAVGSARRQEAEALLAALGGSMDRQRESARLDTQSPLEALRDEANLTAAEMNEALESIQARGINSLTDGITDAIMGAKNLGDVFKGVANQIIADLIRVAVQQTVVNALLGGGGGGGFLGGLFGGGSNGGAMNLTGMASGGWASAGRIYRVNEGAPEFFQPASDGRIIPMSQAAAARPAGGMGGGPVVVQLTVGEGQLFEPRVQAISGDVSIRTVQAAAPSIVKTANTQAARLGSRPRV